MTVKKHNYICKYNLPATCFGLIRPASGWNTASEENYLSDLNAGGKGGRDLVSATIPIFVKRDLVPPSHRHLDQTDNFPQMLYSNLKMAELGRNM